MPTVPQAFDDFMRGLELTEPEKKGASRQHNDLRGKIREHLGGVLHDIIVGSYARRTAIRSLNDIDLFLVLDSKVHIRRLAAISSKNGRGAGRHAQVEGRFGVDGCCASG
jgi:tRNA nucleotidyltransferase (CCA-adding enzyme)